MRKRVSAEVYRVSPEAGVQWGEKLMNIRRLGTSILRVAIRRAPPELQQWGNAMLNEMDAIANDWAAFWWALGGARSLFRPCELPINDVSEVPGRLAHFQNATRRWQRAAYFACFAVIGGLTYHVPIFPNFIERIGYVWTILGSGFMAVQLYWNYVRRRAATSDGRSSAMDQYRGLLQHRRDFHTGIWFWSRMIIFFPGPLLFVYGMRRINPDPGSLLVMLAFIVLGVLAIPLNLRLSRKFQREIDRVDQLRKPQ